MKMKRFLSLLLALVMTFALAAPAFAAEPDDGDPNEGIMPLGNIYKDEDVYNSTGTYESTRFASVPGNGKYIKIWYANRSDHDVTITLYRTDKAGYVASKVVKANDYKDDNVLWYIGSDTEHVTYYVRIHANDSNTVIGYLSILQTDIKA